MSAVSRHIKKKRIQQGMTQDQLAEPLFVTRQTVSNWETGRSQPDIDTLVRIAEVLKTDANRLIYGPPQEPNRTGALRGLCLSGGFTLLAGLGYTIGLPFARQFSGMTFTYSPVFLMQVVVFPLFLFFVGWTLLQGLSVFGLLKPLRRVGKAPFFIVLGLCLLLFVPILLFGIQETIVFVQEWYYLHNPGLHSGFYSNERFNLFPDFLFQYCYSFLSGWRKPMLLLCSFLLGIALWLTKPRKKKSQIQSNNTEDNLNSTGEN